MRSGLRKLNKWQTNWVMYKEHPENYKGNTAKACEFVRLALTGRKNSPTLFDIMQVLGEEEVTKRLNLSK